MVHYDSPQSQDHFRNIILIALALAGLLGCSKGMGTLHPGLDSMGDSSHSLSERFEAEGFHLRRALDRNTQGLSHTCATRNFLIQFAEQDAEVALAVARYADTTYEHISGWLQFHLQRPIDVRLLSTQQPEIRYRADSQILGFSRSRHGSILLTPEDAVQSTRFAYRLAQLFLRRITQQQSLPWWFSAGMSGYLANLDQINPIFKRQLLSQMAQMEIRTWNELARTDGSGQHPAEMYVASMSIILFLVDRDSEAKLRSLLGKYNRDSYRYGYDFQELFQQEYGSQVALESDWRTYLTRYAPPTNELRIERPSERH